MDKKGADLVLSSRALIVPNQVISPSSGAPKRQLVGWSDRFGDHCVRLSSCDRDPCRTGMLGVLEQTNGRRTGQPERVARMWRSCGAVGGAEAVGTRPAGLSRLGRRPERTGCEGATRALMAAWAAPYERPGRTAASVTDLQVEVAVRIAAIIGRVRPTPEPSAGRRNYRRVRDSRETSVSSGETAACRSATS